jgi:hypothetical protein
MAASLAALVRPCVARVFVDQAGAVLHQCIRSLIGAHCGSRPSWISARGQASTGPFGSPVFAPLVMVWISRARSWSGTPQAGISHSGQRCGTGCRQAVLSTVLTPSYPAQSSVWPGLAILKPSHASCRSSAGRELLNDWPLQWIRQIDMPRFARGLASSARVPIVMVSGILDRLVPPYVAYDYARAADRTCRYSWRRPLRPGDPGDARMGGSQRAHHGGAGRRSVAMAINHQPITECAAE